MKRRSRMQRRDFIGAALAGGAWKPGMLSAQAAQAQTVAQPYIERAASGRPHAGKALAAIQPHSDDIPIFAAGTVAKLIDEGYAGYLIRVTNDDMAGPGSIGTTVLANEKDNNEVGRVLGVRKIFNLNYGNHMMRLNIFRTPKTRPTSSLSDRKSTRLHSSH